MSLFKEIPPTAGFQVYARDYFRLFSKNFASFSLEDDFKNYLNTEYAKVTYSGTAALYFILESLKRISSKKTVIIPSFICPLVPLAISRAGLKIRVCDINKDDFNYSLTKLKDALSLDTNILAVIINHLGGIPLDFESIKDAAAKKDIFMIEDCAQALGAKYKTRNVGTLGDFAFFSLCRGKGLTIYEGGVAVSKNKEHAQILSDTIKHLEYNDHLRETVKILELFGYWIFYRPCLFWFVYGLPSAFWEVKNESLRARAEYFNPNFAFHKVSALRKKFGHIGFKRIDAEINKQRQKANRYIEDLSAHAGFKLIRESNGDSASYPYLTLVFDSAQRKSSALNKFKDLGLGVSEIYALSIADYDYLKGIIKDAECANARSLSKRQITLSTNTFLKDRDQKKIIEIIKGC